MEESTGRHEEPSPLAVVAIASSAGGLRALTVLLSALPASFPAAIVVVQHLDPHHLSLIPSILARRTAITVKEAGENDRLSPGVALVAPPDRHVLVNEDYTVTLAHTALVHFVRPSADLLFESVAAVCQDRAIGVVLTGTGRDGAMGAQAIKKMGGTVIVQDPATAEFSGMPYAAVATGDVDAVLPLEQIATELIRLTNARSEP